MLAGVLERIIRGPLGFDEAKEIAYSMLEGRLDDVGKAAILVALRVRGEAPEEVAGFSSALRSMALRVDYGGDLLDTAGTGGDGRHTLNVSTAAALTAAALGVGVAKHGNRGVSSRSGSADFMEALGYNINHGPDAARCMLERVGFTFLYAPRYHKLMANVMGVRRRLGVRTIFNLIGPLSNPAGVRFQVLGVAEERLMKLMAEAGARLGYSRLAVVHGYPGIDEVSVEGPTRVLEASGSRVEEYLVDPEDLGVEPCSVGDLTVSSPGESVSRVLNVFKGAGRPCDRGFIAANAGLSLYIAGITGDPRDGVEMVLQAFDEGRVMEYIGRVLEANRLCMGGYS